MKRILIFIAFIPLLGWAQEEEKSGPLVGASRKATLNEVLAQQNVNSADKEGDPTKNVLDLSNAANRRQDDLRDLNNLIIQSELRRLDDLRKAETTRINEVIALRSQYDRLLAEAEAKRIDAIRAVDVAAVGIANERATGQAVVLAKQVTESADTLRTQQAQAINSLTDRLQKVEQSQSEARGRQALADPAMEQLVAKMSSLITTQATSAGKTTGLEGSWSVIIGVLGMAIAVFALLRKQQPVVRK